MISITRYLKSGFQPKFTKSKTFSCNVKALLREDIDQDNNDQVPSDDDEVIRIEKKFVAFTPSIQRQRPVLARAAKTTHRILEYGQDE